MAGGIEPPLTHDLMLLLEKVLLVDPAAEALRDSLSLLMPYAVEVRYPDDLFMPSDQDASEAREAAGRARLPRLPRLASALAFALALARGPKRKL